MKEKYTERLGTAPLGRLLIALSVPSIAATVTVSLYNVVDTFWVARLGHEAIAALTIVLPYQILYFAAGAGTGAGVAALVSRRFGENKLEATNRAAGQIFFLSLFWGLLFMGCAVFWAPDLLRVFGATPDIMEYGQQYLVITAYGAPQIIFALVASNLIRSSGDAVKPMIMMISASVLNIVLDPLLILGIGPFPEMGIAGAAIATVIAQSVGAGLGLFYFFANRTAFRIKPHHLLPDMAILRDIYRVGAPSAVMEITESLVFILFNNVVSAFGSVAIAAVGMVMRISDLAFMPIIGVAHGLLPIVGYNFGSGDYRRLWRAVVLASVGISALLAVATIFIEALTPQIVGLFSQDAALLETTVPAMRIMLIALVLVGPNIIFIVTLQGLSRGAMALVLSLLRQFLLFLPLLYLFAHFFGLTGVWVALPISDALGFAVSFLFIYWIYRAHRREGKLDGMFKGITDLKRGG